MRKLSTKITCVILIVVVLGMVCLFALTESRVSNMAQGNAEETLLEAVRIRGQMINMFVDSLEKEAVSCGQNDVLAE